MMNVYIIDFFKLRNSHGLDTYIYQLSKLIVKYDKEIKLNYIWVNSVDNEGFKKEVNNGVSHFYIPGQIILNGFDFDIKVVEWLKNNINDKENVIFHFNWINHCSFASLLKSSINCKIVLSKHCIPWRDKITDEYKVFLSLNNSFLSKETELSIAPLSLRNEQLSYIEMDHIICVTKFAEHALKKMLNYPAEKISIVYNGIDFSDLPKGNKNKTYLKKKYGFALNEQIILFVGSITERKGTYELAKGFDQLVAKYPDKNLRLVFIGTGNHNKLFDNVKSNWSKITITGGLQKQQLFDFYHMADIGVVPSYVEQCSYTTIEMMSIGLPIIVAEVDGLKEIVPDDCGIKVKLEIGEKSAKIDINDLIDKLLYFIENKEIATAYGVRAKAYALKKFSSRRMVKETIEVYKKLFTTDTISNNKQLNSKLEEHPMISIILPCYNAEMYIKDCLNSIICQSYDNYELIIIDDGSTDNTSFIIKNYDDSRIKYINNIENKGIVYSLNKGLSFAQGKYICRIDADHMMHKNRLQKQVEYLEDHPDITLVGSWQYIINESKKIVGLKQYFTKDEEVKLILPFKIPFSHPSVMMKSNVVKSIKYSDLYSNCEDYNLWMEIVSNYKITNLPECLTYSRLDRGVISNSFIKRQKDSILQLQSDFMHGWGINPTVEELIIHAKINTSQAKKFFSSEEKIIDLIIWVNKVLTHQQKKYNFPVYLVEKMQDFLIKDYYGINLSLISKTDLEKVITK